MKTDRPTDIRDRIKFTGKIKDEESEDKIMKKKK